MFAKQFSDRSGSGASSERRLFVLSHLELFPTVTHTLDRSHASVVQ